MESRKTWTEADVNALLGQSESIRLEFKSGAIIGDPSDTKWVDELSKQVSAFANSEGGELILGIREEKKSKVASSVDGVPITLPRERLQQLIEGNVSPDLPGIRFQVVKLSAQPDCVVFVIQVPQGITAYQANDGRYYGRSEFEVKHLRDRDIRLRMSRGKVAQAEVLAHVKSIQLGAGRVADLRAKHAAAIELFQKDPADAFQRFPELIELIGAGNEPDEVCFDFVLRNNGDLTIRDPAVRLVEARPPELFDGLTVRGSALPSRLEMRGDVVYPGDERHIAESEAKLKCMRGVTFPDGTYIVKWKVFMDNSPPSEGEIDLGSIIQSARTDAASRKPKSP